MLEKQGGQTVSGPGPVRRLQIRWRDGEYVIVGEVRVDEMTLPASDEFAGDRTTTDIGGCWFELRDGAERVLYRQVVTDPIEGGDEMFEASGTVHRVDVHHEDTTFELLVPDIADAQNLVLVGLPTGGDRASRSRPEGRIAAVLDLRSRYTDSEGRRGNR